MNFYATVIAAVISMLTSIFLLYFQFVLNTGESDQSVPTVTIEPTFLVLEQIPQQIFSFANS